MTFDWFGTNKRIRELEHELIRLQRQVREMEHAIRVANIRRDQQLFNVIYPNKPLDDETLAECARFITVSPPARTH